MIDILLLISFAAPVALAALGETVGQKSGVINIGLEGIMLVAAYVGAVVSLSTGAAWVGLIAGTAAGAALSVASGLFTIALGADQVVVGTAINLCALGLTGTLFENQFGRTGKLFSVPQLTKWGGVDAVMIFTLIAVALVTWLLFWSAWGLAARAAGEYPVAAEASGLSVTKLRFQAAGIAGLLGGLGGAYLALGIVGSFAENMNNGRGFIAIAMVTFGRWKPVYVFLASLAIGYLDSLQYVLQARGSAVPFQLLIALPYIAALAVLVAAGKGTLAPAVLGRPYGREK
jgi:ABC-type uncharacterized transport system permease subunit